jgi:hypothetical protein
MTDYHLRFTDRDEAVAVLASVGIPDGPTHDTAVDHVGEVVLVPAVMDGDEELEPAVIDTRHHVNLRTRTPLTGSQLSELASHLVYPVNPVRVWA